MTAYRRAVAPWLTRVANVDDLTPGARVVVGCSGGADSLALLALARARGSHDDATVLVVRREPRQTRLAWLIAGGVLLAALVVALAVML